MKVGNTYFSSYHAQIIHVRTDRQAKSVSRPATGDKNVQPMELIYGNTENRLDKGLQNQYVE